MVDLFQPLIACIFSTPGFNFQSPSLPGAGTTIVANTAGQAILSSSREVQRQFDLGDAYERIMEVCIEYVLEPVVL